jgi:hypothetical protein
MSIQVKKLIGDTLKVTWVNSGVTPTSIYAAIYNGSDTLVNSVAMTSSGNGHYFSVWTVVDTPGFYVAETLAQISGNPYKNRIRFKAVKGEAD